jgi:hypothetical protein
MAHRPKRRDILAICLASAIIGLLTLAAVIGAGRNTNRPFNFGFGPVWIAAMCLLENPSVSENRKGRHSKRATVKFKTGHSGSSHVAPAAAGPCGLPGQFPNSADYPS